MKENSFLSKSDIQKILESPVLKYDPWTEYHYIDDFYETIKQLGKNKDSVAYYQIIIAMERFARIYDLFRPNQVKQDHYYWGTVKIMEAVYSTLSRYLNIKNEYHFTNASYSIIDQIELEKSVNFEEISWKHLIEDIHRVSLVIKKTIGMESLKVYSLLNISVLLGLQHSIKEYIKILFEDENVSIEFFDKPPKQIKANNQILNITFTNSSQYFEYNLINEFNNL